MPLYYPAPAGGAILPADQTAVLQSVARVDAKLDDAMAEMRANNAKADAIDGKVEGVRLLLTPAAPPASVVAPILVGTL